MAEEQQKLPMSAVLMAIAKHVAHRCKVENKAFMDCKNESKHPAACTKQGDAVTTCVIDLLKDLNEKCPDQLKEYHECLDYYSHNFQKCRKEQKAFEESYPV